MDAFNLLAFLVTLAAIFGWVNHRFVRLPGTIGLMVITMGFSLLLVALGKAGPSPWGRFSEPREFRNHSR